MTKAAFIKQCYACRDAMKHADDKQSKAFHQMKSLELAFESIPAIKRDRECYKALEDAELVWQQAVINNRKESTHVSRVQ